MISNAIRIDLLSCLKILNGKQGWALGFFRIAFALACASVLIVQARSQISLPGANQIDTLAGNGYWGYTGDGQLAIDAQLAKPGGVAIDSAGNLIIADTLNNVIREVTASSGTITTIAGNGTAGYAGDGQLATTAELNAPWGVALDRAGNVYIADTNNSLIRRVDANSHTISTVVGLGTPSPAYTGDGGPALNAALNAPTAIVFDSAGNYYISDTNNNVVRKVSIATGYISTVAGNGTAGYSGDNGRAQSAELNGPVGLAVNQAGNLFIADAYNNTVREVDGLTGTIRTVAGNGTAGYTGDGGSPTSAELNFPLGVAVDSAGNLVISDSSNNVLRKVSASSPKTISTIAGDGTANYSGDGGLATSAELSMPVGLALDSVGNIYIADFQNCAVRAIGLGMVATTTSTPTISWNPPSQIIYGTGLSGTQLNATANVPGSFTYSPAAGAILSAGLQSLSVLFAPNDTTHYSDSLWTVPLTVSQAIPSINWATPDPAVYGTALSSLQLDATSSVPGTIVYAPPTGTIPSVGTHTLTATLTPSDTLDYSTAVATVNLIVSTAPGPRIITTMAGNGFWGNGGIGGPPTSAELANPIATAVDAAGDVFIADTNNNVIKKVSSDRSTISVVAGNGTKGYAGDGNSPTSAELSSPGAIALDSSGNLYVADSGNNRVRMVNFTTNSISTIAGNGTVGYSGDDGPATGAELYGPAGLAFDSSGNLYIVDQGNMVVRKVSGGAISTVVGNGSEGYAGDGGPATSAKLDLPTSIAIDAGGNLLILDTNNFRVRKVSGGIITTFAGNGTAGYSGDNGPAANAELHPGAGLAVDALGDVYISDTSNNVVRVVDAYGMIGTLAGSGPAGYSGDGGSATSAKLNSPMNLALDAAGNIYIADYSNDVIREVGSIISAGSTSAPTFSPSGGNYPSGLAVSISAATPGATIYYTTDGTTPTTLSNVYTAPVTVSTTETLKAIATAAGYSQSTVASATYTITPIEALPSFSPAAGTYTSTQIVSILDGTAGATIFYTTDGTTPTTSSNVYSAPVTVSTTETLKAVATAAGYLQSAVASATYTINPTAATPRFFPPGGAYPGSLTALITDPTPRVTIYYTTDGTVPTSSSASCYNECLVPLSTSTTIHAMAAEAGYDPSAIASVSYTLTAAVPLITGISPVSGPIGSSVTVAGMNLGTSGTITFNGIPGVPTSWGIDSVAVPVPAGATTGPIVITNDQGTSNSFSFAVSAGVSSISPTIGTIGTTVVISGAGFGATQGKSVVAFNGVPAAVSNWSDTTITATVPTGATTGFVSVAINGATVNGPIFALSPTIVSLSPSAGPVGALVTISGTNFGSIQGNSTVAFGQVLGMPSQWSQDTILVAVPSGAVSGPVVVSVTGNSSNAVPFSVGSVATGSISGTITQSDGINPVAGASVRVFQGSSLIASAVTDQSGSYLLSALIPGTYRLQASASGFGTGNQSGVSVQAGQATTINVALSNQRIISYTYDKNGRLATVADSASGSATYTYDQVGNILSIARAGSSQVSILGFSPTSGPVGTQVTVSGTDFAIIPGQNTVSIGGVNASIVSGTPTQLVVTIPTGAQTGPITVATSNGSATSSGSFSVTTGSSSSVSINSFTPTIASPGTSVTISGTGFDPNSTNDLVKFNGASAAVTSSTTTVLTAVVPAVATSGPISVETPTGHSASAPDFVVVPTGYTASKVDFVGQLAMGGSFGGNLQSSSDIGIVLFHAQSGNQITLAFTQALSGTSASVLKPDGTLLQQPQAIINGAVIFSGIAPESGTYTIILSGRASNVAIALGTTVTGSITAGSPTPVNIQTPAQNVALTFSGNSGQLASLLLSNSTIQSPYTCYGATLTLLSPDGGTLGSIKSNCASSTSTVFLAPLKLPVDGTYTAVISPPDGTTGSGTFTVSLFNEPSTTSLQAGTPQTITINTGQFAKLSFSGSIGQFASVQLSNSGFQGAVQSNIVGPDGSTLTTSSLPSFGPVQLPASGTYTIILAPTDGESGTATITLTLAQQLNNILTSGTPANVSITTPGENAVFVFTGIAGQYATLTLSQSTGISGMSLLDSGGNTINPNNYPVLGPQVLQANDTYSVLLGGSGSATLALSLSNVQSGGVISPGVSTPFTISTPSEGVQFTFTATAGQLLSMAVPTSSYSDGNLLISLTDPSGITIGKFTNSSVLSNLIGPITAPATGTYTVSIAPVFGNTGSGNLIFWSFSNLTGLSISPEVPTGVSIGFPGQNAQLAFTGVAGQLATVHLSNVTFTNEVTISILNPDGTTLSTNYGLYGNNPQTSLFPVALPVTGTYTLVIAPKNINTGGATVNLSLQ